MPYNPSAEWTAATALKPQRQVYYAAFDGLTSMHFSTGPVDGATVTKKLLLKNPTGISQKIDQLKGRNSLSLLTLELVDRDRVITDLVATEHSGAPLATLINRKVTLYAGYATLPESKYAVVAVGQVSDCNLLDDGETFRVVLADLQRNTHDDVFTNSDASTGRGRTDTHLTATATAGNKYCIAFGDLSGLSAGDKAFIGPNSSGEEERVTIRTIRSNGEVGFEEALQYSYASGDPFRWATTIIRGNPINMIWSVLTGTFSLTGDFPLLLVRGMPTGLGISTSEIEEDVLAAERDRFLPEHVWEMEIAKPTPGFRLLEDRIYKFLGYPTVSIRGRYSFRLYRPAYPDVAGAGLPQIAQDSILSWRWKRAHELHLNRVKIGVGYDIGTDRVARYRTLEDTADQAATRETIEFSEDEAGFALDYQADRLADACAAGLFRRFLNPPPQITLRCDPTLRAYEAGEVVEVTHPLIPNEQTGERGLSGRRLEIVERAEQFADQTVEYVVQEPGYTRPAFVGASGTLPDYDSATDAQREYLYIGPPGTPAPDFDDGTPPYEVI